MGEIISIHCNSCHADWECRTGSGLMHGNLESAAESFSAEVQKEIELAAKQTPLSLFTFSFCIARCNHCGRIVSVPVLTLTETDNTFIGLCPVCNQKARPVARLLKTACPVCGKISLRSDTVGRWD